MEVITTPKEMTAWSNRQISANKTIALVPTMGCFHEGHLALMREAASRADRVVTSLFVNPLQFGPNEDFDAYPRTFNEDREGAQASGVHVLFAPERSTLYPEGFSCNLVVGDLTKNLCGGSRPGHFDGVTTVVGKLFNIVKPQVAVFGQKDFQQLAVIRKMVTEMNWDVTLIGHPIVREPDGLAMSSRNKYLNPGERMSALCLSAALEAARSSVAQGERDAEVIIEKAVECINAVKFTEIDYISVVNDLTLIEQKQVCSSSVMALAVRVGKTRLIDNGYLVAIPVRSIYET
nr:pantoate--beta-alanine ligase [Desulfobulbaceae bacterium]